MLKWLKKMLGGRKPPRQTDFYEGAKGILYNKQYYYLDEFGRIISKKGGKVCDFQRQR